jgi:hypothetical protein
MTLEFPAIFGLGLVSGLHCLQMCGPIVLCYSLKLRREDALRAHLAYNSGRILTYMFLGALAGAAGGGLGLLGRMAGLASGARIFAGAAMLVAGVLMIGLFPRSAKGAARRLAQSGTDRTAPVLRGFQTPGLVRIQSRGRFSRAVSRLLLAPRGKFALGLTLGFLPCGLVYAALLKAVETAAPAAGALTMLAFGMGTAVALLSMGFVSSFAGLRLGNWSNRLAAVSVMAFGAILLWRGLAATPVCHG